MRDIKQIAGDLDEALRDSDERFENENPAYAFGFLSSAVRQAIRELKRLEKED